MPTLLQVENLTVYFRLPQGTLKAVNGVNLHLAEGETLAIVGESGCGKSVTAYAIMRLISPPGEIVAGKVTFAGTDLLRLNDEDMRQMRGNRLAMIFQEPMTSLNPVFPIGTQIIEGLTAHRRISRKEARTVGIDLLKQVGIASPATRFTEYPHQMSGGMRQRVMIAMSLACEPQLLIADEPTTALDVTIQAQILELIDRLKSDTGMGLILITHDLGVVAERSHQTAVMYAGEIVEYGLTRELLLNPVHPYTQGLLNSLPRDTAPGQPLQTIPGSVPDLMASRQGCGFCSRCPHKNWQCEATEPVMKEVSTGHFVRCWKFQ